MKLVQQVNISRHIARHLVGPNHTEKHHKIVGWLLIILGGVIALLEPLFGHVGKLFIPALTSVFHAFGLIPLISSAEKTED